MNLLGEGFPDPIIKQVIQRQKIYGAGFNGKRTPEQLVYLNANTSWCKLVSSVNIDNQYIIQNKSLSTIPDISDNRLARKFVLFNGVTDEDSSQQRAGITPNNSILGNNNAYGIGGTEFGIRPMMGIKSATIKHENRGSLRRATIQIKAFNRVQFDIIDTLYLRLGFYILLEWGHSMYYDNEGTFQNGSSINNNISNDFLNGSGKINDKNLSLNYSNILELIQNQRLKSNGNYDAMMAKVSNFHWSFLPDGSYDITLDLVSIGDIIESFKINSLISGIQLSNPATSEQDLSKLNDSELITSYADKHTIGQYFYQLKNNLISLPDKDFIKRNFVGTNGGEFYYIRLGAFIKFIEETIMYYVKSQNVYQPMLKFDYDTESNLMYIEELQVSVDPTICMVNRTVKIDNKEHYFIPDGELFESPSLGPSYGRIMNIYVNIRWILLKLDELKDVNTNKVVLIDLLNNLLSSINNSLGGVNNLETSIDDITNTVIIRDNNPLPNLDKVITTLNKGRKEPISNKYAYFDLYGYSTDEPTKETTYGGIGHASFIKDFSFTTEISPDLSTIIQIGASSNSTVVGEDSTAFSKFNIGLTDRYKEEVLLSNDIDNQNNILNQNVAKEEEIKELAKKYSETYILYTKYLVRLSSTYGGGSNEYNGDADTYKDAMVNYITYLRQLRQASYNRAYKKLGLTPPPLFAPGTGFIPFNMSLTMDGLSGTKIYSKFFIDTSYLPSNYPDNAEFLIKNVVHKIENNKWFTTLESVVISKGDMEEQVLNSKVDILPINQTYKTGPVTYISNTLQYVTSNTDLNLKKFLYPTTGTISSKVGLRAVQNGVAGSDQHRAIDIAAPKGTPVYSSTDGVVSRIGASGYGPNAVIIEINPSFMNPPIIKKYYAIYGHMDTTNVSVGMKVTAGQQIGTVGDKGSSGAFHLHFQIRDILYGYDSSGLSLDINSNFPPKGGKIVAKQNFI